MAETKKQKLGKLGEDIAVNFLKKNGYTVKGRNLHFSHNEIDIIAEDKDFLVFVEVKTRSCLSPDLSDYGSPGRAVTSKKRTDTVKAAKLYLSENFTRKQPRIDVIEIYMKDFGENTAEPALLKINHIRNAFDVRGRKH